MTAQDRIEAVTRLSSLCGGVPSSLSFAVHEGQPQPKERARVFGGRGVTPKKTRDATKALAWTLKAAKRGVVHAGKVALVALFYRADARHCDADNLGKLVLDAGNSAGLWNDDSQVKALTLCVDVDRERPRTVVAWAELDSGVPFVGKGGQR